MIFDATDQRTQQIRKEVGGLMGYQQIIRKYQNNEYKSTFLLDKDMKMMW